MNSIRHAAAAAVLLALVAGCGTHPGAAADVDGTRIPLEQVDRYTAAYCAGVSSAASPPTGEPVGRQDIRQQIAGVLVRLELARGVAEDLGVEVSPADLAFDEEDPNLQALTAELDDQDRDAVLELFSQFTELDALLAAIGREVAPEARGQAVVTAGQEYVAEQTAGADISVDPRLGLDSDLEVSSEQDLSVSDGDEPELSPAQTCG